MPKRISRSDLFSGRQAGLLAGGLAMLAIAVWVKGKARQAEAAHPPRGRFVEVEGVRLHYVERGQGVPVVLIHGNGSMIEDVELSGLVAALAERYRVIVFDRPGFGHSERPRTTAWTLHRQANLLYQALRQLGIERPVVAAHSLGTQVAIAMALKHPYYVRGMVLASGYYYPTLRMDIPFLAVSAMPFLGDLLRHTISPLLARLTWPIQKRLLFGPGTVPANFEHDFPLWLTLRPSQLQAEAAESAFMIPEAAVLSRRYAELTMPIIILAGDGDRLVDTRKQSVRLQQDLPHSVLQIVPGAGHMLHYIAPDQFVSAVDAAVDGAELDEAGSVRVDEELHPKPLPSRSSDLLH